MPYLWHAFNKGNLFINLRSEGINNYGFKFIVYIRNIKLINFILINTGLTVSCTFIIHAEQCGVGYKKKINSHLCMMLPPSILLIEVY